MHRWRRFFSLIMGKKAIIFWRFLWERKVSFSLTAAGLLLYVWLISAFAPVFFKDIAAWRKLISIYPKEIFSFFGGTGINIFTIEGFLSMEFFSPWWIFIIGGYALALGSAILGKEIDRKTVDILLAQPLSRSSLLFTRLSASLLAIFLLAALTNVSLYLFSLYYDFTLKLKGLFYLTVAGFVISALLLALTLFFSLFFRERSRSLSLAVAVLLISYFLDSLGKIFERLEWVRPFTLFFYYRPYDALTGKLTYHNLVLAGLFLFFALISFLIFRRQDLAA